MNKSTVHPVPKIGLALSGGTLKAAAHVGVLSALEVLGIRPHCVAGTSAGAFVAALYARGYSTKNMIQMVKDFPGITLLDYAFPVVSSTWSLIKYRFVGRNTGRLPLPPGLLRGVKLETYIRSQLGALKPEISYYMIATDLYTGNDIVFGTEQPAEQAARSTYQEKHREDSISKSASSLNVQPIDDPARIIRASCSLPGILTPIEFNRYLLVDGGLRDYVPVKVLRAVGCTHILAVNLYRLVDNWRPDTFAHVLSRSFDILLQETIDEDVGGSDVLSITPNLSHMSFTSVRGMNQCVQAGQRAVAEKVNIIRDFLTNKPR